jgi:dTMP kinase
MVRAKFITFEGGEGAGKSTQIELLAAALTRAGISVRTSREPGGSPGAGEIRRLLVTGEYQGYGHGLGREAIEALTTLVLDDFAADLTLILDVPVELGIERALARRDGEDRYESLGRAFHERLREGFREIAEREPDRCALIDASGDVETVQMVVRACVAKRLGVDFP